MILVLKINGDTFRVPTAALHNAIKKLQAQLAAEQKENERLLKCENDLRKIHEEHMEAAKRCQMGFQYFNGDLMVVSTKEKT